MYIRFAIGADDENPRDMHDPLTEAAHLKSNDLLAPYEEELVDSIFEKFNDELPCPPWGNKNWPSDAISWFKVSAQNFIALMYDLIAILKEHDVQIQILKSDYLFKIYYEDAFQVIAVDKRF